MSLFQFHPALAGNRGKQAGTDIALAMHRHGNSLASLAQDMVTAMNPIELPTFGLQSGDDFMSIHRKWYINIDMLASGRLLNRLWHALPTFPVAGRNLRG